MPEAEPNDDVRFRPREKLLREDVRTVGALLGEVLVEQRGKRLFDLVERARRAARRRRADDPDAESELAGLLRDLEPATAGELVRAFSTYFGLVNLTETVHRIRRRQQRLRAQRAQDGSIEAVFTGLAERRVTPDAVRQVLGRIEVVHVLTAHPTEATRRTLLQKQQRAAAILLEDVERPRRLTAQRRLARLRREISSAWQTSEHLPQRPTVSDEVEQALYHLAGVLWDALPDLHESIEDAFVSVYDDPRPLEDPVLRFGSWVGGDMDGNPAVDARTLLDAVHRHRRVALRLHREQLRELFRHLSQSITRVGVSDDVLARVDAYRRGLPAAFADMPARFADMPYRQLLWAMTERLGLALDGREHGYVDPVELAEDLRSIHASLEGNSGRHAGLDLVRRALLRVRACGFHVAGLDVRQDAAVHRDVVARLLGEPAYVELDPSTRAQRLRSALAQPDLPGLAAAADAPAQRSLDVMRAIGRARREVGPGAVDLYIVSMAADVDDALAVLLLARVAGLVDARGHVPLDVVPLFETVDDLERAPQTLAGLLADPLYAEHLAARGRRQVLMLGYSDSGKDSGIAASRWSLFVAQQRLLALAAEHEVALVFFHGRGGTISRGGSKPREAVTASPAGAASHGLRVTEQGEIIHARFGLRDIAARTLELVLGAVVEAELGAPAREVPGAWRDAAASMAKASREAYRALVHDDPGFHDFFREATPIDVIERMQLGSRPASRRDGHSIDDLRAIPWVFAWTQCRLILPGWYGLGAGLDAAAPDGDDAVLREMAHEWPFFRTLLADVEMVLAKSDLDIARRYAALGGPNTARLFGIAAAEHARTHAWILRLRGASELLAREPVLARSIHLRNPYVDPMSMVQIDLLRRWREGGRRDPELEAALMTTVKGIARGLQNTG